MLSLQQAYEVKESILAYLKATFTFQDKKVHKAFYDFVNDPRTGIFKGPYLSIRLPYVKASEEEITSIPLEIKPNWKPYDHQVKSWYRLSTAQEHDPQPTLVTTGTGSGKTESFLYPILDYCYKNIHRRGIKVIILYPMNALATDQAKRLAEAIYEDDKLKGKITAGLFIGEGRDNKKDYPATMGKEHIVENRNAILDATPDILLTNFKMLDYALMQSKYHPLWTNNFKDLSLLRFLVLDELHTYDGAQGTDVANLIRRLKLKLNISQGQLCPVGTSATIGSGEDAATLLAEYAAKVFGETFDESAVIQENRVSPLNFFDNKDRRELDDSWIGMNSLRKSILKPNDDYEDYLKRQYQLWKLNVETDSLALGKWLNNKLIVFDLLQVCEMGILSVEDLIKKLSDANEEFRKLPEWDEEAKFNPKEATLQSIIALIAEAKEGDASRKNPLLYVNAQLWVRELSGVLREVSDKPVFTWKDELAKTKEFQALPPWFCRECGASGWLGEKHEDKLRLESNISKVYEKFFGNHRHIMFVNTSDHAAIEEYQASEQYVNYFINSYNLEFFEKEGKDRFPFVAYKKLNKEGYNDHYCPKCNSRNTVSIIGTRNATLSSIAVSQTLATDLDPQNEKQRKILAFTNSVQDAAHQAGFVEARNYRFTFRSSLQKVINEQDRAVPLPELHKAFTAYWKKHADSTGKDSLGAYYYRFFPSDYIGKAHPKDYYDKGKYLESFQKEFDYRIQWEIYSEFGYNALIGRTLEKTSSSAVHFQEDALEKAWDDIKYWLEANNLENIQREEFLKFILLFLHRIRTRGGISHSYFEKFRSGSLSPWDLNWQKDNRHFLNKKFGTRTRFPRLLAAEKDISNGLLDSTFTNASNWFHQYFDKCFPFRPAGTDILNEFYRKAVEALVEAQVLDAARARGIYNYAINPAVVLADKQVYTLKCNKCEHQLYTSGNEVLLSDGFCLAYGCSGHYQLAQEDTGANYYQLVYNRNRSPRIYAADHTGLLDRKVRENKEKDFKQRERFNSLNALVATSTLEMGIDIGTLNTVLNNSVPPLPSNFLQRIGRAGRATGSAMIINFSQSKAHDLYYFAEPKEMMEGEVNTPGCYLEAKEILKRHFFAFTIDSWTSENPQYNIIPTFIRDLRLEHTDLEGPEFFMNRILNFLKANENKLFNSFNSQYQGEVKETVFDELRATLINESFYQFYKSIFKKLKEEIWDIRSKQSEIQQYIKGKKLSKNDEERKLLDDENKSLGGIIGTIKKRVVLEHLTNVGGLPNYAFPETGVTLNARVLGQQAIGSTKPPLSKDFELVRSSKQAIKEFAPNNLFYSQGYRFKVGAISTRDLQDESNFHKKRFCSNCDHMENEATAPKGGCPKCGHESWAASSNVHSFAKLLNVRSFNSQSEATLADDKDDREDEMYKISRHFYFDGHSSLGAWAMKKIPFGIEFVKKVLITESNLGRLEANDARKVQINSHEVPAHGFISCKFCGKSTSNLHQKDYKFHYGFCKHKDRNYAGKADDVFEEIYFFRELNTEALKILLPVQEFNSEAEITQFVAGIELGLKKYFRGNPQHIEIRDYREFNHRTMKFDRYVVLYDTVPGGTGYLEKLFDRDEFKKLLKSAYKAIKECSCQHFGKDGCYHCIYTYANQYTRGDLSRAVAEKRFRKIVEQSDTWEHQPSGLSSVTNLGQIEESELEERFIRSISHAAEKSGWSFEKINVNGIINYNLTVKEGEKEISYIIIPQLDLGPSAGVQFHTTPDFILKCIKLKDKGIELEPEELFGIKQVALYLDGFQYHASEENNRFEDDVKKRRGILSSPEFITWTLTWRDLELYDEGKEDYLSQQLSSSFIKTKNKLLNSLKNVRCEFDKNTNNLDRLLFILQHINKETYVHSNLSLYLAFFQHQLFQPSFPLEKKDEILTSQDLNRDQCYITNNEALKKGLMLFDGIPSNALFDIRSLVHLFGRKVYSRISLKDVEKVVKVEWENFWTVFNICQFFELQIDPRQTATSLSEPDRPRKTDTEIVQDILEMYGEEYHELINILSEKNLLDLSKENETQLTTLVDTKGDILAEAELIVEKKKWVFDPFDVQAEQVFKTQGYSIQDIESFDINSITNETTTIR